MSRLATGVSVMTMAVLLGIILLYHIQLRAVMRDRDLAISQVEDLLKVAESYKQTVAKYEHALDLNKQTIERYEGMYHGDK